jgi:murein DD-endopeptidase MepM/ murein hydrolase activator NlpD
MKSLIVFLGLVVITISSQAQNKQSIHFFKYQVIDSTLLADAFINENAIEVDSTPPIIDIKANNWNTEVFNPYKNVVLNYPLQIKFKDSNYSSPISRNKVITSRYGWRKGRPHKGIDIDLITGDSIFSMFDGIVRFAKYNSGHGRTIIVRHYNGLETVYAHLSAYGVKPNDTVSSGQYIGKGGVSGNARGSHLHLVVNYKGVSIHPEYLFNFDENNTIKAKELWVTKHWTRPYLHNSKRSSKFILLKNEEEALANAIKQKKIYIVQPGDTLSKISLKNNTSIAAICKSNYLNKNAIIRIGQKLVLE